MPAGLASPHPILVLVLLLFGVGWMPELARGLGTGPRELREAIPAGDDAGTPEGGRVRGVTHAQSEDDADRMNAGPEGL